MTYPGDGQSGWGGPPNQGDYQGYPQQVYPQNYGGSYGGLGVFSGGDEPPPKKSRTGLWLAIAAVVVVLVGGGVTAFVLTRPDGSTPVAQDSATSSATTTTTTKPSTTAKSTTSSAAPPTCEAAKKDWNCLAVPTLSYSYDVPKGWSPAAGSAPVEGLPDVKLVGLTVTGAYDCGGKGFTRGGAGGVVVPQTDLTAVAKDFAQKLATQYYKSAPRSEVKLGEPKRVTVAGTIEGVQVDAVATTSGDQCLATKGVVKVLVLKGDKGYHVFMANGDLEGGPAEPRPQTEADLQAMVDSVKPLSR
ncbi:hypothetical protein ACIGNX_20485 [Actinosynnema sp. NPDC053489]|uniref:hypothetical protein n=1 Tax=Actinosynnema sp. NPDC053489 TaxID=3363916 RepID=UPI0037CA3673